MKRVSGFTLTDVIVTMIISLLIVGTAFSIFRMTYNQLFSYKKRNSEYQQLLSLHLMLQNDFIQSETIECNSNAIKFNNSFGKGCEYSFTDTSIIRQVDCVRDTFLFPISEWTAFNKKEKKETGIIDELSFVIEYNKISYPYQFYKAYPSEMELNNE